MEYCRSGAVLVGGKVGELYGRWNVAGCVYYEGKMECDMEMPEGYIVYEITSDYLIAWADWEAYRGKLREFNGANSLYMYDLLKCLNSRCGDFPNPMDIYDDDSENVNKLIDELKVQKISWNGKSAQFILNKQTFDVVIDDSPDIRDGFLNYSVTVSVSSEGKKCNNTFLETNNIKPWCSTENAFILDSEIIERDDGGTSHYITMVRKDNAEEFDSCLRTLISPKNAE